MLDTVFIIKFCWVNDISVFKNGFDRIIDLIYNYEKSAENTTDIWNAQLTIAILSISIMSLIISMIFVSTIALLIESPIGVLIIFVITLILVCNLIYLTYIAMIKKSRIYYKLKLRLKKEMKVGRENEDTLKQCMEKHNSIEKMDVLKEKVPTTFNSIRSIIKDNGSLLNEEESTYKLSNLGIILYLISFCKIIEGDKGVIRCRLMQILRDLIGKDVYVESELKRLIPEEFEKDMEEESLYKMIEKI